MGDITLCSYYPNYNILDEVITCGNYDTLNLYFDIKNNLQTIFMEHAILNIVESSLRTNFTDTSVFESVMNFLSFHKIYAANRKLKINFFIFFESGHSNYHLNVSKKYKISRRIDDLYGLDREKRDLFFNVVQKNLMLLEKASNKMPNIKVFRLPNLEADFIPYYLIKRGLVDRSKNVGHIIYSNDHDLLQCLDDDVFVFVKTQAGKKIVRKNTALKSYLKFTENFPDEYLPLAMAVIGDPGDNVDGIKGIGGKTIEKILPELVDLVGGIENLYHNVMKGKPIFGIDSEKVLNKHIKEIILKENTMKVISNNLKLVSFEILSRFVEDPISTEMLERKNLIHETINKNEVYEIDSMRKALEGNRVYFTEGILDNIYL